MILLRNLSYGRGSEPLVTDASLQLHPGWKIGLVGANGCGKSSFFALLRGELHQEAGDLEIPAAWTVAHVGQETPALPQPALEFVLDGDVELREVEQAIAEAEAAHDGERIGTLHARYAEIDGYSAKARAAELMNGLGFSNSDFERPVAEFSGGWRVRLNLGRALMCRSDLLLLDEPTNHLDLDAVLWLEDWLRAFPGAVIIITHDREVLDAVAGEIVHVENRRLTAYAGNYSAFEEQRAARLALQQASFEKQQRTVQHLEAFINRFRAKATKAKQAQSRIKALEKMERVAPAHVDSPFSFRFRPPLEKPRQLFSLEEASLGYGTKVVLSNVEWSVLPGDAIGLLGPNGAGKSTLLKAIVGQDAAIEPSGARLISGELHRAQGLRIGYFAQHQVDQLRLEESALWHLGRLAQGEREQVLRDFLGGFDIRGDMAMQRVESFSGGEKARLALALIVWQRPNLLLLDEPTNHLDIDMREALAEALIDFEGALIVVAHDRHLLASATDQWRLVADGRVAEFDGDLDDYKEWARQYRARASGVSRTESAAPAVSRKDERRAEAEARQKAASARKPYEKKLAAIEAELGTLTAESAEAETWLASSEAYQEGNRERLQETLKRRGELAERIAVLEEDWLWNQAAMEKAIAEG